MKKLAILAVSILLISCSKPDAQTNSGSTDSPTTFENKFYTDMVFLDATFEKFNVDGNSLPVSVGDAVTVFDKTLNIKITSTTFETNLITPVAYFKSGSTYSLPSSTQYVIYESSRIIIKKIEYPTSYGKDKRQERYSY